MTSQDRDQLQSFMLRQARLEEALLQLRIDFKELQERTASKETEYVAGMPPLPVITPPPVQQVAPPLPPLPVVEEPVATEQPEVPIAPVWTTPMAVVTEPIELEAAPVLEEVVQKEEPEIALPPVAQTPLPEIPTTEGTEEKSGGFEFQFGRWLARIGVVLILISLILGSTLAYQHLHHLMGPWSRLTILAVISVGLIATGLRFERRDSKMLVYGRTMAGGGLACLYYTLYGATYVAPLQVIHSQVFGGVLLLAWSAYVLYLAEKKKSELLSVFAIALAYFSSAITPVGDFTMAANLILSVTAVIFLVRNAWTGLPYLCLVGTYLGLLRQFISYDSASNTWFDIADDVTFWPSAMYLAGAWVIYTAGVFLAKSPRFAAGKRMTFLCLNNGALVGLLTTAANLSGFGHIGQILCVIGGAFIATSYLSKYMRADASEVTGAYLMQGLAIATGGVVITYTGMTRGLLITTESVFLAGAGAFSRNAIMRVGGYLSALLGVGYLLGEIDPKAAHPYTLIAGGTAAMLVNAWLVRRKFWNKAREVAAQRFVFSSAYYVLLAVALLALGITDSPLSEAQGFPLMAVLALVLTFSVYLVPLFELPQVIQLLLLYALYGVTYPLNDTHALSSELIVGAVTLVLIAWWSRQKSVQIEPLLQPMLIVYSVAMVAIVGCAVHPLVGAQGWMIAASGISLAFLLYGIFTRTWSLAVSGQLFLAASIYSFFASENGTFPWTWWAAAVPVATTFFTAWIAQEWLKKATELPAESQVRGILRTAIYVYQGMTVALIVRLVVGLVPNPQIPLYFYALGAVLMAWNLKWPSAMGLRCAMALDIFGSFAYFEQISITPANGATWLNAAGMVLLLAQPALLRRWGTALISRWEIIGLALIANVSISVFVYWVIHPRVDEQGWMIAASVVSLIYMAYGAFARTWQFMLSGQIYLALAVWTFLVPPDGSSFPWTWWAAAIPPAMVFLTGWFTSRKLADILQISDTARSELRIAGKIYQAIALGLAVRWIYGIVPSEAATLAFFTLATGLLIWNVRWPNAFGVRAGLLINLFGLYNYLTYDDGFSLVSSTAFFLFLAQPAILRYWGRTLVTEAESWLLIFLSAGMAWFYVSHSINLMASPNMTMAWAIFALVLTLIGFASNERRQRWCGLVILAASIVRGGIYDFWGLSDLYKVLTFFALAVICLGLSFLYYKFADRLKNWL